MGDISNRPARLKNWIMVGQLKGVKMPEKQGNQAKTARTKYVSIVGANANAGGQQLKSRQKKGWRKSSETGA